MARRIVFPSASITLIMLQACRHDVLRDVRFRTRGNNKNKERCRVESKRIKMVDEQEISEEVHIINSYLD